MKCPSCFERGLQECTHILSLPTGYTVKQEYMAEQVKSDTVPVNMLAYTQKNGGRLMLVPKHLPQPSNNDYVRLPNLDQMANMPDPHHEAMLYIQKKIMSLIESMLTDARYYPFANGTYAMYITINDRAVAVTPELKSKNK